MGEPPSARGGVSAPPGVVDHDGLCDAVGRDAALGAGGLGVPPDLPAVDGIAGPGVDGGVAGADRDRDVLAGVVLVDGDRVAVGVNEVFQARGFLVVGPRVDGPPAFFGVADGFVGSGAEFAVSADACEGVLELSFTVFGGVDQGCDVVVLDFV